MKLICFSPQAAAITSMLEPFAASVGELVKVADTAELKKVARAGDVLVTYSAAPAQVPPQAYEAARELGMASWALSDHWVNRGEQKAGELAQVPNHAPQPADPAPTALAAREGLVGDGQADDNQPT